MKRIENLYRVHWVSRPTGESHFRVYKRAAYAESFFLGVRTGTPRSSLLIFNVGNTVRLNRSANRSQLCPRGRGNARTAKIQAFLTDIEGGVFMDRDLRGTRYWNINDLEKVC
jgi:hypothetical protein